MSPRFVWDDVRLEVQLAQWREALERAGGNITRAAKSLGFHKSHGMRMTKAHGLTDYAAELRVKATGHSRGRPWDEMQKGGK